MFKKSQRANFMLCAISAAFGAIVLRLFVLQIVDSSKYKAMANKEQMKQYELPASRGVIYAMDGKKPFKLVMNETIYTLFADPQIIEQKDKEKIIQTVKEVAGGNLVNGFEKLLDKKETRYQVLGLKLSRKQAESIKAKKLHGIGFIRNSQRVYPEGQLASQTLGFVNAEGGKYGIEEAFNSELSGKDGLLKTTTDINGMALSIGKEDIDIPAQNGKNLVLSIDRNIQSKVEKVLKEKLESFGFKNGSVLVMNPDNGKVMAMANYPTYNPAEYSKVKDAAAFNNSATTLAYENGSVIKSFTMAMGINEGVASADSRYYNTDSIRVDDRIINNLVRGYTGSITLQTAMTYSLNTGMVTIAQRLGGGSLNKTARDKIYDYFYNRFGLGHRTGIEIYEGRGVLVSPDEAEGNAVRYSNMTFGQGMDTTMIQTTTAFASIVNGGTLYKPSLLNGEITQNGDFVEKKSEIRNSNVISESASEQIRDILVTARHSVGRNADLAGYRVGGKTGTSQTLVNGRYVDNQTIGSYLGFGGNSKPKFVIMVSVWGENQNPQGHAHAQPIFTEISNWLLSYLKINPKG